MDLESVRLTIENACEGLNSHDTATRKHAEQILLDFRASQHPFSACRHILETSPSDSAKFQAVLCFRDAAVREWAITSPEDRQQMRRYLLHYLLHVQATNRSKAQLAAAAPDRTLVGGALHVSVVAKIIEGALALLLKRGWLESTPEEKSRMFGEIQEAVTSTGDLEAREVALGLLEAVVLEFSPATASPMGELRVCEGGCERREKMEE